MHALPSDFDPSRLVGLTLEQVSFAQYSIYLGFSDKVLISVMSEVDHWLAGLASEPDHLTFPANQSRLMTLLEHAVAKAWVEDESALALEFEDGQRIVIHNTFGYEAYHLQIGGKTIIV